MLQHDQWQDSLVELSLNPLEDSNYRDEHTHSLEMEKTTFGRSVLLCLMEKSLPSSGSKEEIKGRNQISSYQKKAFISH